MTAASLTDRYVWAAARNVPEAQRADLQRELRERIGDAVDALVDQGHDATDAERAALTDLGDPGALAAAYVDRPFFLIGPRYYLVWWRLLKLLAAIVLPIIAAVMVFVQLLTGATVGEAIGTVVSVTLTTAVHLAFWTTLVFAVLERTPAAEGQRGIDEPWTVDRLPQLPDEVRPHRVSDLVASLVGLAVFAGLIVWQQFGGVILDGRGMPLLNPELWSFWLPYFLVLIAVTAAFSVAIYAWGWTWWLALANLALQVAFTVPALWLLLTGQLVNPDALDAMGWPWGDSDEVIVPLIVTAFIAAAIWNVIDGAVKAWRAGGARREASVAR
ncbi:permease prefix domain 1-containing protein [Agromyces larvae]|uniref:Permease prefix domain 1-containing protein n=1 Tax=Agromyces larvae TaxID=2929802 RepID=A0ABY4C2M9_9MICO|nr:permease prefix domain 1-containing protein [Agromyces larvae]UOE44416.1 permease prefix domain 1-containing protein [Agromyces larvae]